MKNEFVHVCYKTHHTGTLWFQLAKQNVTGRGETQIYSQLMEPSVFQELYYKI